MISPHLQSPLPPFPAAGGTLWLPGAAGTLELACAVPAADIARKGIAVISHPHPLHGGTMHHKVVTTVERALRELGLATVRHNFRGVEHSAGVHDGGIGETDDLITIATWARATHPGAALWLAGFSFGSYVTVRAASRLDPARLILIAPPVGRWNFADLAPPSCPWLIVQGEEDEVVAPQAVFAWAESLRPAPHLVRMPETGHFFHRRLMDLRGVLKNSLAAHLPPAHDTP
jgi:alpha/beta superfamily hydrolase